MIRGNIDSVVPGVVGGWVYSEFSSVKGKRVLAFCGDRCVGAGEIGKLRADLRDAGLGDGLLGFEILFDPTAVADLSSITVRFENSDFALLANQTRLMSNTRAGRMGLYSSEELERLDWMARQGWLTQEQFIALRALNIAGYYQRTFSRAELAEGSLESRVGDLYCDILTALYRLDVTQSSISETSIATSETGLELPTSDGETLEFYCFYGEAFDATVLEGAHTTAPASDVGALPRRVLRSSPLQMMLVHRNCLKALTSKTARNIPVVYGCL